MFARLEGEARLRDQRGDSRFAELDVSPARSSLGPLLDVADLVAVDAGLPAYPVDLPLRSAIVSPGRWPVASQNASIGCGSVRVCRRCSA